MKTREKKPLLGITMGDPCGIGPELVLRLLRSRKARAAARFVIFGSAGILEKVGSALDLPLPPMQTTSPSRPTHHARHPLLIDTVPCPVRLALRGKATAQAGRAAIAWIAKPKPAALTPSSPPPSTKKPSSRAAMNGPAIRKCSPQRPEPKNPS